MSTPDLTDYLTGLESRHPEEKNQPLEGAIIIGCYPAIYLETSGRLGIDDDEYGMAGALMREPVDLVPGFSTEDLLLGWVGKEARVIERMWEALPTLKAINFPISGTHFHAYLVHTLIV